MRRYLSAASSPASSTESVAPHAAIIDSYVEYLNDFPGLSETHLLRAIRELGKVISGVKFKNEIEIIYNEID